jgi:hypothetical protein
MLRQCLATIATVAALALAGGSVAGAEDIPISRQSDALYRLQW